MLLDLPGEEARPRFGKHWPLAAAGGLGFVALIWLVQVSAPNSVAGPDRRAGLSQWELGSRGRSGNGKPFGGRQGALWPFALPFEIAGLVLLAAIVGAVVLARRRTEA